MIAHKVIVTLAWLFGLLPHAGGGYGAGAVGFYGNGVSATDFDPVLLQGVRGYPGIRVRINQRAFQYVTGIIANVLNQEIRKFKIPPVTRCIQQINGCFQIYNIYVSRYRCPQRVAFCSASPNKLVLQVQNFDIGITGNLGGQIVFLLPIPLTGIFQANICQVSITVELTVERGPYGPYLRASSCNVQVGYVDAYIDNGGLIGGIANTFFRSMISSQVREMIPNMICSQVPNLINEKVNTLLARLPQTICISQMISSFIGSLMGVSATPSQQYCQTQCRGFAYGKYALARGTPQWVYQTNQANTLRQIAQPLRPVVRAAPTHYLDTHFGQRYRQRTLYPSTKIVKREVARVHRRGYGVQQFQVAVGNFQGQQQSGLSGISRLAGTRLSPPPPVPGAPPPMLVPPPTNLCANCPVTGGGGEDPMQFVRLLVGQLDMRKFYDLCLSLQLLNTQASSNDFTINLSGEISPSAQGGTPFGAFPVTFPSYYDNHMAEIIISDYTINSLLYWLHRKQFLSLRIGPETPGIGELLRTTCGDEDEQLQANQITRRRHARKTTSASKQKRDSPNLKILLTLAAKKRRSKRQGAGGLTDLGICFGDIVPAVKERYPNQKVAIQIRTARAPSIIIYAAYGGMVSLDLVLDADIYIHGTYNRASQLYPIKPIDDF
ncbi:unnamed protein product [Cylicocyclus nassatus]|uniref:Lipid-binding serum glycoprotein N-terminal domain-containing protein n=1 Tax=Cylicocyclus nassatus TaxID=53992 RepID=A0AA36GPX1_CYLNA|nr:unnamed protein product [Cylicocyclus nassatus]